MKKSVVAFRAALLLLSLLCLFIRFTPEHPTQESFFFRHVPKLSAPLCIVLAVGAYVFYHLQDRSDPGQH